ncbi:GNAT family N-acetyltransferase [Thalassotalea ponticola]|uniref:GNAT family N-acetyltransferase n=1 Tax=Thalassotalea ponticola TaxID=1523392 RepID=UPI0025B44C20|nr:GNAT family N-acetyltransferase [Thalassotalea ponticola]MDN3652510.1 GNAT family N-acetyltransferase [Thalassotalea ponticola]
MTILIDTERLQMRHFHADDTAAVYAFSSDPDVTRYTGDAGMVTSLADARGIIDDIWLREYQQYGYGRYALVHKADDKVIGFCGFKYDPQQQLTDLGYRILPAYWQQGLASEAVAAVLNYGRDQLKLTTVVADAAIDNTGSNKVLLNHGFQWVKRHTLYGFEMNHYQIQLT